MDTKEKLYASDSEKGSLPPSPVLDVEVKEAALEAQGIHVPKTGFLHKLWAIVLYIDRFGVEVRGIERIKPQDRTARSAWDVWDAATMWLAANTTISTFSLGTLGPTIFGLGLKESVLTILFFNLLSTAPVAYFAVWGPRLGLRQMTISRFSFGYYVALIPTILNVIACVGWSTINSIVGAQALRAVSYTPSPSGGPPAISSPQIPTAAAIVLIAVLTMITALFGYRYVHLYERFAWMPIVVIFLVSLGNSARYMHSAPINAAGASASMNAAGVLSFGASVVGFGLGWASLAADYTVNLPENVSGWKVFFLTYAGLNLPCILIETLGAAEATITRPDWVAQYEAGGVGGLLGATLSPAGGFGKFLLVLAALSIVGNNIPNMYSFALTFQVLGRYAQMIPRVFLVIVGTVVYVVLAVVGADHFEEWLDTLLILLSYWLAIYTAILLEEHWLFRRAAWRAYNPDDYGAPRHLPRGGAALLALCVGIAGAVLGMAAQWYVGVLGRKIGDPAFGGDIGFILAFAFTALVYPVARYVERRFESPARFRVRDEDEKY